jgi:hypothetical protein
VWRLPECRTPAGKILLEKMIPEKMILDRTLPAGALPARLLRSGEYSIRCTFDLIRKNSVYWYANALSHGLAATGLSQPHTGISVPAMEVYG